MPGSPARNAYRRTKRFLVFAASRDYGQKWHAPSHGGTRPHTAAYDAKKLQTSPKDYISREKT